MTLERISQILADIGKTAKNPRVITLAGELATEIERQFGKLDAKVARTIDSTTYAVTDVSETLTEQIVLLRQAIAALEDEIGEHKEVVSGRVHTLANHVMAIEVKIDELAQAIDLIVDYVPSVDNASDDTSSVDTSNADIPADDGTKQA